MAKQPRFKTLTSFLCKCPGIQSQIGTGIMDDGNWWCKFSIDIDHPLAWHIVQEFGHILNYISLDEPLPTVFKPVSSPPYMNGGPKDFLSWVIESTDPEFKPKDCMKWLKGRLPNPVDDESQWNEDD